MQAKKEQIVYVTLVAVALHPKMVGLAYRSRNGTCFALRFCSLVASVESKPTVGKLPPPSLSDLGFRQNP